MSDLDPSELGTKSHWDQAYERELTNFTTTRTDEGVIWFEESNAESTLLRYLSETACLPPTSSFLDIGTGNGHLLFTLRTNDDYDAYTGAMVGIDYSPAAVTLARKIAAARGGACASVRFEVADVIADELEAAEWVVRDPETGVRGFDVVLDKGTYDAISLSEERLGDGRRVYEDYPRKVAGVVRPGGLVVITSCNWTVAELREKFGREERLRWVQEIKYPSFRFGGKEGQAISSVVFERI